MEQMTCGDWRMTKKSLYVAAGILFQLSRVKLRKRILLSFVLHAAFSCVSHFANSEKNGQSLALACQPDTRSSPAVSVYGTGGSKTTLGGFTS